MALYQATNIFPSSFAGRGGGTVDARQPLTVSWQVNGNSAMTGYQIEIFQNTAASTRVYSSGRVDIAPFWGVDYTGKIRYFSTDIQNPGLVNGYASGYKLQITQYWDGGSVQQASPSYFITRAAPSLSIRPFQNPISGRLADFSASYAQTQGDVLDWFQWLLCEKGHEDDPLEDSGNIYGSGDIRVSYDGLFTGINYRVRCMVQTENGIQADTGWVDFTVQYTVSDMQGYVEACLHPIEGVALRWPKVAYIPGKPTGPYTTGEDGLDLPNGSSVTWDERNGAPLSIRAPWTLGWSGVVPRTGTAPVLTLGGGRPVSFSITPSEARVEMDGRLLFRASLPGITPWAVMRLVITPGWAYFRYAAARGGLYPSAGTLSGGLFPENILLPQEALYPIDESASGNGLYPRPALYPGAASYVWHTVSAPLAWVQPDIGRITLHGEQICQWLTVLDGEIASPLLDRMLTDLSYRPVWTLDTRFLAGFQQGLNGGNITPIGDTITGVALYRRKTGESRLRLVANLDIGTSELIDQGFRNQESYSYYLFVLGARTYVSAPLISNPVTPMFWNWTVLKTKLENGAYHVKEVHVFRSSVSTDAITNNNSPQLLQNFTTYPNRQPSSCNYQSSTLTGYIGRVDFEKNIYVDTVGQADALRALSVSIDPKFLRDRKGNLWRIETGGAVSFQTGDNQPPQPYFGTFPWVEVGSVDGASIFSGEGDWTGTEISGGTDGQSGVIGIGKIGLAKIGRPRN